METSERIMQSLRRNRTEHYKINISRARQTELFYVREKLDISRCVDVTDYKVTVYRDFEADGCKMRGSADALIYADMTDEEMDTAISRAYFAASFVKNKFYELPRGEGEAEYESEPEYDLTEEAYKMADALLHAKDGGSGESFVNSAEIFARRISTRIINSEGIDVGYTRYSFEGEFVTQCISGGQDVELYSQFAYRTPEYGSLAQKVREALKNTKDRAAASASPRSGKYAVILSEEHVKDLLDYYVSRAGGGMIYAGYSSFKKDSFIQGSADGSKGELLDIKLKAVRKYSPDGILMKDRVLTENGVLRTVHADARFSYYLGTEPTGDYSAAECSNGTMSLEEMCRGTGSANDRVLHVAAFSDFQTDSFSGHFGGEIRLAYLYEKDENGDIRTSILTGGSINGSILEAQDSLTFSTERYKDSKYDGPLAVRIDNVSVAGADI